VRHEDILRERRDLPVVIELLAAVVPIWPRVPPSAVSTQSRNVGPVHKVGLSGLHRTLSDEISCNAEGQHRGYSRELWPGKSNHPTKTPVGLRAPARGR
jgi:hypothetical protein